MYKHALIELLLHQLERDRELGIRVHVRVPGTAELRKGRLTVSTVEVRADISASEENRVKKHISRNK